VLQLLVTADGSHTIQDTVLNESYHSIHGAIQESRHVFIKNGLENLLERGLSEIRILEVGFGTGLNALLTFLESEDKMVNVLYHTVEAFPLPKNLIDQLNYGDCLNRGKTQQILHALHAADWDKEVSLSSNFTICKVLGDVQKTTLETERFDMVYYDAFAPSKQPELWSLEVLKRVIASLKVNRIFVTYSASGQLKRDLRKLGMEIETLVGPPGKKEMTRATKTLRNN